MNWRSRPLTDIRTIVELIGATKTTTGVTVQCAYDPNWYPTGEKITDRAYNTIPFANTTGTANGTTASPPHETLNQSRGGP